MSCSSASDSRKLSLSSNMDCTGCSSFWLRHSICFKSIMSLSDTCPGTGELSAAAAPAGPPSPESACRHCVMRSSSSAGLAPENLPRTSGSGFPGRQKMKVGNASTLIAILAVCRHLDRHNAKGVRLVLPLPVHDHTCNGTSASSTCE